MNSQIEAFVRTELKKGLSQCTEAQQLLFKRMYAHGNLLAGIEDVVDTMDIDKLDCALGQVQRTLAKRNTT